MNQSWILGVQKKSKKKLGKDAHIFASRKITRIASAITEVWTEWFSIKNKYFEQQKYPKSASAMLHVSFITANTFPHYVETAIMISWATTAPAWLDCCPSAHCHHIVAIGSKDFIKVFW